MTASAMTPGPTRARVTWTCFGARWSGCCEAVRLASRPFERELSASRRSSATGPLMPSVRLGHTCRAWTTRRGFCRPLLACRSAGSAPSTPRTRSPRRVGAAPIPPVLDEVWRALRAGRGVVDRLDARPATPRRPRSHTAGLVRGVLRGAARGRRVNGRLHRGRSRDRCRPGRCRGRSHQTWMR